jgi:hypothetical protein
MTHLLFMVCLQCNDSWSELHSHAYLINHTAKQIIVFQLHKTLNP